MAQYYSARTRLGLIALAVIAVLCAWVLAKPFISTIILACVVALLSWPLHVRISKRIHTPSLAAACSLGVLVVSIIILFSIFFWILIPQAIELARIASGLYTAQGGSGLAEAQNGVTAILETVINRMQESLDRITDALGLSMINLHDLNFSVQIRQLGARAGQAILAETRSVIGRFAFIVAHLFMMFFILFFLLRDGKSMLGFIARISPLSVEQGERILNALRAMARAVFVGGGLVALCQGILAGIGFAVAGLPALVLGLASMLAAFVPFVGTALIWGPAAVYLYFAGKVGLAVFLVIWGVVAVSCSDSLLRPFFMRGGSNMPVLLLFLAIMGGFSMFGVLGLLYGPLMLTFAGVALTMFAEYMDTKQLKTAQPHAGQSVPTPGSNDAACCPGTVARHIRPRKRAATGRRNAARPPLRAFSRKACRATHRPPSC